MTNGTGNNFVSHRILAKDPSIVEDGDCLSTVVEIPLEEWRPGPGGARVQVIDHDSSIKRTYARHDFESSALDSIDPEQVKHPAFHCTNLFATAMATIGQFERALGRRVSFANDTHQIKLAPHAFRGANAYYDRSSEAILFGYFKDADGKWIDTCLSYDIIVHEMTHAILDGLRPSFTERSSPDQAAFHEAFADIIALLSSFTRPDVVRWGLTETLNSQGVEWTLDSQGVEWGLDSHGRKWEWAPDNRGPGWDAAVERVLTAVTNSFLVGIAPQLGEHLGRRQGALRSLDLARQAKTDPEKAREAYRNATSRHGLGEVLVAAVMGTFFELLRPGLYPLVGSEGGPITPVISEIASEVALVADRMLTLCIQAIDYTAPAHIEFVDYMRSFFTVYSEVYNIPNSGGEIGSWSPLETELLTPMQNPFSEYGVEPELDIGARVKRGLLYSDEMQRDLRVEEDPRWLPFHLTDQEQPIKIDHRGIRLDRLQTDRDEAFRFVHSNMAALGLDPEARTTILSVRPSIRTSWHDGSVARETVIEVSQRLSLRPAEFERRIGQMAPSPQPEEQPDPVEDESLEYELHGGTTLILDESGGVKYSIHKRLIPTTERNKERVRKNFHYANTLAKRGWVTASGPEQGNFAHLHLGDERTEANRHEREIW